ncbi:ATP-binding protein [Streptomyces sp. NPDC059524]|uniref:ATP-binding protein n=1 Tax=Streptomyces sp. NPDC059524 TaxID=3346856 RepID=UPI0036C8A0B2
MTSTNSTPTDRTQLPSPTHHFTMQFSSTPRGARLARRLSAERLAAWGIPYGSDDHDAVTLIVSELAANAIRHGRVPGRDFHLHLTAAPTVVRAEVTDTRSERIPRRPDARRSAFTDGGRGLILVAALASAWGWRPRTGGPGKTVWAVYALGRTSDEG